jgi:hypothetical protein
MYASVVAWTVRRDTAVAERQESIGAVADALQRHAGFTHLYVVQQGQDGFVSIAVYDSVEHGVAAYHEVMPLLREAIGDQVESMQRFAGPVGLSLARMDAGPSVLESSVMPQFVGFKQ